MKKATILLFMLSLFYNSYAQLPTEGFETWPPVGWGVYDNGFGLNESWEQSEEGNPFQLPYEGTFAAFVDDESIPGTDVPQDWLVTPQFTMPANPQLRFFSRLALNGDNGGIYRIMISDGDDPSDLSSYIEVTEWTEFEINPVQQEYIEKLVTLPDTFTGSQVYVAFVMEANDGDRWLIDNVQVVEQCLAPENLSAGNITETSADLSWDDMNGATEWEIQVLPASDPLGASGTVYDGTLPYLADGLTLGTAYKFYVRSLCSDANYSEWAGPFNFQTVTPGTDCSGPIIITGLPYTDTDNTSFYGNDLSGHPGTSCGVGTWDEYLNGNDVVYAYTPVADMVIDISATDISAPYTGMFVYTDCNNIGTQCYAAAFNTDLPDDLTTGQINVSAGTTYYIVISTSGWPDSTEYTLNIEEITCPAPSSLQVSGITTSAATISWVEYGDAASWEYVIQAPGTGEPAGSGTTIGTTTYTPDLDTNTAYEFYVRASCGGDEYSDWVGPLTFSTLCDAVDVPFTEGFNTDSVTENCWKTINVSGAAAWNLSDTSEPFEGDEAAALNPEFASDNEDWLISPGINLTADQRLRFNYKISGFFGSNNNFRVMLSTTGIDPEDFTTEIVPQETYDGADYEEIEVYLNTIPSGTVYIAWIVDQGGTGTVLIDNVRIDDIPLCPDPTDLTAGNFTTETAELSWEPGFNETSWEVVVQAPGTGEPTTDGEPAANPYTADSLSPNTTYEYYVRATCGSTSGNSNWVGPYTFTTECAAFDVPFHEGFNSDSPTQNCWKITDVNGGWDTWSMDITDTPYEGDETARYSSEFTSSNDDWLISPGINLTGNQRLSFRYRAYSSIYPVNMEVRISTTGTAPEDFTTVLLPTASYNNIYYIKKTIDLTTYTGQVYIAWHAPGGGDSGMYYYMDDVLIEDIPECADPYDITVDNITDTSAEISWTPGNDETQWEVIAVPQDSGIPTVEGTITSDNPYLMEGLSSGTPYDFYIRSVCGDTNSIWNGPIRFVTAITNDECADAITLPVNAGTECIESLNGTVFGSSQSSQPSSCDDMPADDVWYEFTATAETHNITLSNIQGSTPILRYEVYEGDDCEALTSIFCSQFFMSSNIEGLTIGQTYKVRVYTISFLQTSTFNICVRTVLPPISTDNTTYTVEELVTDVLVGSECAQVSNVTWSTGVDFVNGEGIPGPNGIAYFDQNGSAFPMAGGIILSTGDAMRAEGPEDEHLGDGDPSWVGDADLDAIILEETGEAMNSTNATVLEFDFVPLIDNMSFDFLFVSEEYGTFQCDFSDTFAFLLTDSDGNTTNLAVVPGTTQPVSVVTIRDQEYNNMCESVNPAFFDKYYGGLDALLAPISFTGQTQVLTAQASVVPNTTYHIKMVIADRGGLFEDTDYDSAVFLAAGSFNIGQATLGDDLLVETNNAVCANETYTIESGMSDEIFEFEWLQDGEVMEGETEGTLEVTEPGIYTLNAMVIDAECIATDSIVIEFYTAVEEITQEPVDLVVCEEGNTANFNLAQNDEIITAGLNADDFVITYHLTEAEAVSGSNALESPYSNTANPQVIYVRVFYEVTGCYGIHSFSLIVNQAPEYTVTGDTVICEDATEQIGITPISFEEGDAEFSWTLDDNPLPDTTAQITADQAGLYEVTITLGICVVTEEIAVTVTPAPVADILEDVEACNGYILPELNDGNNYFTGTGGTGDMLTPGTEVQSTQIIYIFVETGGCTDESSFNVTIIPTPDAEIFGECIDGEFILGVTFLNDDYTADDLSFEWRGPDGMIIGGDQPTVATDGQGEYQVMLTPIGFEENCPAIVTYNADDVACTIQKGISPNGDNKNDFFDLTGMNVTKLSIFNRYGQEVYSRNNYVNEWSGQTNSGDELPSGTYFYAMERSNGESRTGWIYVNRQEN